MYPSAPADKRRFYRHPLSVPIEYHEKQYRPGRSAAVDISEGGICFLSERFIAKGCPVNLRIPVGNQVFSIEGQVAYSNRLPSLNRFKTGVAFMNATHAFRAKLAEEMLQIQLYKEKVEREAGEKLSDEEAARRWIEKYAKQFGELF